MGKKPTLNIDAWLSGGYTKLWDFLDKRLWPPPNLYIFTPTFVLLIDQVPRKYFILVGYCLLLNLCFFEFYFQFKYHKPKCFYFGLIKTSSFFWIILSNIDPLVSLEILDNVWPCFSSAHQFCSSFSPDIFLILHSAPGVTLTLGFGFPWS